MNGVKYCIVRYNDRLRYTIKEVMRLRGYPHATLARKVGVAREPLHKFLTSEDPKDWRLISQWSVIKVCNELGIELELQFKVREDAPKDFIRKRDAPRR